MRTVMTWSIVAHDAATGGFGVAVASKVLAVGALCPWAAAGVGALSTQSYTNPLYGPDVLAMLRAGGDIAGALQAVTQADDGRDWRQVHGVDTAGRAFAYTGAACVDWNGHLTGDGVSVAGNMLAGPQVVEATMAAWIDGAAKSFPERLLDALAAGEAAGGDKRGKQSAAIRIVTTEDWPAVDLRVDDAVAPIQELQRLLGVFLDERAPYYATLATRDEPSGVFDPVERERVAMGYYLARGKDMGRS